MKSHALKEEEEEHLVRGVLITDIQKRSKKKKINERRKKIGRELSLIAKLQKKRKYFPINFFWLLLMRHVYRDILFSSLTSRRP